MNPHSQSGTASNHRIFISYRREDSQHVAGRLFDRLIQEFDRRSVFKDVDSIPLGHDFREHLQQAVGQCNVMLVLIGEKWGSITDDQGVKRLENSNDFVRLELEAALDRGIPIVPVLVGDVQMPNAPELPVSLQTVHFRQATRLRPDPDFDSDVLRLIRGLKGSGSVKAIPPALQSETVPKGSRRSLAILMSLLLLVACGTFAYYVVFNTPADEATPKARGQTSLDTLRYVDDGEEVELKPGSYVVEFTVEKSVYELHEQTYTAIADDGRAEQKTRTIQVPNRFPELVTRQSIFYPLVKQKVIDGKTYYRVKTFENDRSEHTYQSLGLPSIKESSPFSQSAPEPPPKNAPAPP